MGAQVRDARSLVLDVLAFLSPPMTGGLIRGRARVAVDGFLFYGGEAVLGIEIPKSRARDPVSRGGRSNMFCSAFQAGLCLAHLTMNA
jgi:hypothetical protein